MGAIRAFWADWQPTRQEATYLEALNKALERILANGPVVAIYVGGSLIRRELHEKSDIDIWTITRDRDTLERIRALEEDVHPHVSYHGFTVAELESGKRSEPKKGSSSVKRFVASIPELELVYGSLDTSSMPTLSPEEDLAGRIRGWPIMLDQHRTGSMSFSHLAKYLCWIARTKQRIEGTELNRVLELRRVYPDGHVVSKAVGWSRYEPCEDEEAAIEEMQAYVDRVSRA